MELTTKEEAILSGQQGEANQIAMALLVDIGEFFEADKLIPVSSAHISGVSYLTGGDGLIDQLNLFVEKEAKVAIPSTLNPCGMDRNNWEDFYIDLEFATKQFEILKYFEKMDVTTTCSCTPYDFGHILTKGQHVAWAESSAVTFANSYFGARTNKEDSLSVLSAAIIGKTPNFGFHLTQNRVPNVNVNVEATIEDYSDYSILGEIVGNHFKSKSFEFGAIPQIEGIHNPRPQDLKSLGAAFASFGTQLYHIKNITPEQELLSDLKLDDEIIVTNEMVSETYARLQPQQEIDLTVMGCPNANFEEIREVANLVRSKKLKPGKEFWVFANSAQRAIAKSAGFVDTILEAGGKMISDTCPEVMPYDKKRFPIVLTNSVKAQHYIAAPSLNGIPTYLLPLKQCVELMFE